MTLFHPGHPLAQALSQRNYTDLTAVQSAVLDPDIQHNDLLVSAQTGSGKTVAYGLAMAEDMLQGQDRLPPPGQPLALIVAPTRELAMQVQRELAWLYQLAGGQVTVCVGGMDPRREARLLANGTHMVVGTPGRLRDHLERGALQAGKLRTVVLDEADEMLDLGFRDDLEFILEATPQQRRTLLFSATLPHDIISMARRYQREARRIAIAGTEQGHADIDYRAMRVAPNEIEHAVVNVLRFYDSPTAMVFCNTRDSVRHLCAILQERGFAAVGLSGEMSQNERNHALQSLRDGRSRVCVATDVAARGIDLPNLGLVIHADLPLTAQTLQHRSGRTGRAGRKGVSVLLVQLSRRRRADQLLHTAGISAQWSGPPSAEDIRRLDQERLMTHPILMDNSDEDDPAMAQALLDSFQPADLAAALVRLYRRQLPAAEDVFDPGPDQPSRQSRDRRAPREGSAREGGWTRDGGSRDGAPRDGGDGGRPSRGSDFPGGSQWFRLNIGRQKNADPRWLIPMICRQGKITKQDIGVIRIQERETRFEIDAAAAERFLAAVQSGPRDDVRIEAVSESHAPAATVKASKKLKPFKTPWKSNPKPVKKKRAEG